MDLPRIYPLAGWSAPEDQIPEALLADPYGEGARALQIASLLRITEGPLAGERFGAVATEWQRRLIVAVWGHLDRNRRRIILRVVLKTARKSGKTLLASVLALTEVLHANEARAQILMLAAQRDQSRLCFSNATHMIRADDVLLQRFKITDFQHRITDKVTGAELRALSSEASGIIGWGPSVAIIDELHLLGLLGQKGMDLVHGLESGMLSRFQPLTVFITTAPVREGRGIYSEVMTHARKVATGEEDDPHTLALLYEGADEADPSTWWRSNPNLGVTIQLRDLEEQHRRAKARGSEALAEFLSQNLNIDPEDRADGSSQTWIQQPDWIAAEDPTLTAETLIARCDQIVAGLDIGGASDLTGLALIGKDRVTGEHLLWTHAWLSRRGYDEQLNTTPFADARAAGELTVVPNVGDDVREAVELVIAVHQDGKLVGVGCDAAMMREPSQRIEQATGVPVMSVPQGWRLYPYSSSFERAILGGVAHPHKSGLLRWNISNTHKVARGEAYALTKAEEIEDSPRKIDLSIASVASWAVWDSGEVAVPWSVEGMIG